MTALRLRDVTVGYEPGSPLFSRLNLSVPAGTSLAVMAPSGTGKTSLLDAIAGHLPHGGEIAIAGEVVTRFTSGARARFRLRHIGQVFQDAELLPELTAIENAGLPSRLLGEARTAYDSRARRDLEMFGLGDKVSSWPSELSGGERQRVALARALSNEPALILADEPTGALDAANAQLVARHLTQLASSRNIVVVIATHDDAVAAQCDDVLMLRAEQVEESAARD